MLWEIPKKNTAYGPYTHKPAWEGKKLKIELELDFWMLGIRTYSNSEIEAISITGDSKQNEKKNTGIEWAANKQICLNA